jgi:hypothetical protein
MPLPEASVTVVPLPSSKLYAAIGPNDGVPVGVAVGASVGEGDAVGDGVAVGDVVGVGGGVGLGVGDGVGVGVHSGHGVGVGPVIVIIPSFSAAEIAFRSVSMNWKS